MKKFSSFFTPKRTSAEQNAEAPQRHTAAESNEGRIIPSEVESALIDKNAADIHINRTALMRDAAFDMANTEGYLTGSLLVASPLITDSIFAKSVIYLFAHSEEGAMGCILNEPIDSIEYEALLGKDLCEDSAKHQPLTIHFGGPVDRNRGFVLHSNEYHSVDAIHRQGDVGITSASSILHDMAKGIGPNNASLIVGYAGWDAGQLESEIEQNSWLNVPATYELLFNTPHEHLWARASQSIGVDMAFYSHSVGHA